MKIGQKKEGQNFNKIQFFLNYLDMAMDIGRKTEKGIIIDVKIICRALNIDLRETRDSESITDLITGEKVPAGLSLFLEGGKQKACISYNPSPVNTHNNNVSCNIAHEIGHYFLHREKIASSIEFSDFELKEKRIAKTSNWGLLPKDIQVMEAEADTFAYNLLIPYRYLINIEEKDRTVETLQESFGVSKVFAQERLKYFYMSPDFRAKESLKSRSFKKSEIPQDLKHYLV